MGAYSTQDAAVAGTQFGSDFDIETKVVASGAAFAFGAGVFVDAGDENSAYGADSTDASLKFLGVAPISHRSYDGSEDEYIAYQDMNVLTRGQIYVAVSSGLSAIANSAAYFVHDKDDANYGNFTTKSDTTYDIGGYFRSNASGGLARLELRGLK